MTLTELRYVVALAEERHFGRAAQRCHVSQPTLSVALKKLEERLGVILFERGGSEVRITPAGEPIVEQARHVLREAARIEELASAGRDPLASPLRVGVIYTIGPYLLPRLIPLMHRRAARMPLLIREHYTERLAELLKEGEIDAAVLALPFQEAGVVTQPLYDEPFRVLVPSEHPWRAEAAIDAARLSGEPVLLLSAGNCFRDQVLDACPRADEGSRLQRSLEGSSLETIRHMVATGAGVTVLPSAAADELPGRDPLVAVLPFSAPEPKRTVALAWRASFPRPQAIDVLREAILDCELPGTAVVARRKAVA